jgi:2,3-bisphosphoglycerate-dependent phosphoglycerate mutase
MQLYFIRHGQSENNLLWAQSASYEGRSEDPDLTRVGRKQAEALAEFLRAADGDTAAMATGLDTQNTRGFGLTHLYCSLMVRAVQTGEVVARAPDLPLVGWLDIHETGGIHHRDSETGELTGRPGRSRSFFETNHPDLLADEPHRLTRDGAQGTAQ